MMTKDYSKLKRPKPSMPGFVKNALKKRGLLETYKKRPAYQQDQYLGWIDEAKIQDLKLKRLNQMLDELEKGGIFMEKEYLTTEKKKV
jgi:hypothetical protein